jgi:hypothetical protein
VPSEADVAKLLAALADVKKQLGAFCVTLTKEQRKSAVKMRPGGEAVASLVGKLAADRGVSLAGASVDDMKADLALASRLRPLETAAGEVWQLVADTMLEAKSEAWWAATALYGSLVRTAPADAQLEAALQPAVDFFALGRRRRPVPGGTPT